TAISSFTVTVNLLHSNLNEVQLVLTPPSGSGLAPITLVKNRTNPDGSTNSAGITGVNLGINGGGTAIGTNFSDNASLKISDSSASAPYIGTFQPEAGSLNEVL